MSRLTWAVRWLFRSLRLMKEMTSVWETSIFLFTSLSVSFCMCQQMDASVSRVIYTYSQLEFMSCPFSSMTTRVSLTYRRALLPFSSPFYQFTCDKMGWLELHLIYFKGLHPRINTSSTHKYPHFCTVCKSAHIPLRSIKNKLHLNLKQRQREQNTDGAVNIEHNDTVPSHIWSEPPHHYILLVKNFVSSLTQRI